MGRGGRRKRPPINETEGSSKVTEIDTWYTVMVLYSYKDWVCTKLFLKPTFQRAKGDILLDGHWVVNEAKTNFGLVNKVLKRIVMLISNGLDCGTRLYLLRIESENRLP